MAHHLGGLRKRHKSAAIDVSSSFAGFPDFMQTAAKACSQRVFSDQVSLSLDSACILLKVLSDQVKLSSNLRLQIAVKAFSQTVLSDQSP